ncbi:hypothetical protein L6468_12390 [Prevotella communis]|uniref:hypothetical protein n=1 Tax=Prevotella communis TaxID=2913614 RepID=UPI001ED9E47C|nr:hypothetical protein [Prevotella communis]UKK61767.1 hypothetical protein L6468_12390 [Prevotella communis]UKK64593.1 hypothetical protein L6473_12395 [Prevotella communis]
MTGLIKYRSFVTLSVPLPSWEGPRTAILLLLFLVIPGYLQAQTGGMFDDVNPYDYYGNMSVSVEVRMNGVPLQDITPAVFSGNSIRGKGTPSSQKPGVYFFTVYGDETGEPLYFKVLYEGRVIEVDTGLSFIYNGITGSPGNPIVIDLPAPVSMTTSTEGWATTCLPFDAAVPDDISVYVASQISDGVLKVKEVPVTVLPKNVPVLLRASGQKKYEWLSRVADADAITDMNLLKGTTEETTVEAGSVLTLGHAKDGDRELGFWLYNGTTIPANRAYLDYTPVAGTRGLVLQWEEEPTVVDRQMNVEPKQTAADLRYDLSGRPSKGTGGLVINKGKKYLER